MKKLVFLGACLLVLRVHPVVSAAADPEVIVVTCFSNATKLRFVISRGAGRSEVVEVSYTGSSEKALLAQSEAYHRIVQRLYQEGYTHQGNALVGTNTTLFVKSR